jgi:site-specific recombinase XerD
VAQEIVGHDSKQISQHYTHIGDEAIRASLDKIPNLLARGGSGKNRKK